MRTPWPLLLLAACGGETTAPPADSPLTRVVAGAPVPATPSASSRVSLASAPERLGTSASGTTIVAVDGAIFELSGASLEARALYAAGGDPRALGAVRSIAARVGGGAWIAAEAGLFRLDGSYVTHVPLALDAAGARAVSEAARGPLAGLWIAAADALLTRSSAGVLERVSIDDAPIAAIDVAVDPEGAALIVALGDRGAVVLAPDDAGTLRADPLAAAPARAVAAGRGVLWAATDAGLFRWRAQDEPRWTQFTLTAAGAPAVAVRALAAEATTGDVWARTSDQLVRASIDGTLLAVAAAPMGDAPPLVAVDGLGDTWSAEGAALARVSLNAGEGAVGFAADVAPWITTYCAACHRNATADFVDYTVFAGRAEAALARVRSGDMPRCNGGLPCPEAQRLTAAAYGVLEQWIRQGKPE